MAQCEFKDLIKVEKPTTPILIQNVSIFDGVNENLLHQKDVLIEKDRIKKISDTGSINAENAQLIDGSGKTLMPGFIDSHVHVTGSGAVPWNNKKGNTQYNLDAYLYAGITTLYDLGGMASQLKKLSSKLRSGEMRGPNLFHTHIPITIKNSHPIPLSRLFLPGFMGFLANLVFPTIQKESDAKKIIRKMRTRGVNYIKIVCDKIPPDSPEMPFKLMKALVDEAHAEGFKVFVHIGSVSNALRAVEAGTDILAHGIWRDRLTEEQADKIAASGVKIIYTLAGFVNVDKINNGAFTPTEQDRKLVPCCVLEAVENEKGKMVNGRKVIGDFFQNVSDHRPHWEHNFDLLRKRNVPILVGTDSNLPGTYAGATYYQEMYELSRFGLSNYLILKGATSENAKLFQTNPDFGMIAEGKRADLLLLAENPLEKLDTIEKPVQIISGGRLIHKVI